MPLINHKPDVASSTQAAETPYLPPNYVDATVDNEVIPLNTLRGYIGGFPLTTQRYYSQILGRNSDTKDLDLGQSGSFQSYRAIDRLEIRLTQPLPINPSQDEEKKRFGITAEGLIYGGAIPNEGDVFTAETSWSNLSLFRVTKSTRQTYHRASVYLIEFHLISLDPKLDGRYENLEDKVVESFTFHKERLLMGLQPLISSVDENAYIKLQSYLGSGLTHYLAKFFNKDYNVLTIPGQDYIMYDGFLMRFLMKLIEVFDHPLWMKTSLLSTEGDPYLDRISLYDLLIERDYRRLPVCQSKMGFVSVLDFDSITLSGSLRLSGMEYIVYPNVPDTNLRGGRSPLIKTIAPISLIQTYTEAGNLAILIGEDVLGESVKSIPDIDFNLSYVFSPSFYGGKDPLSLLERQAKKYLQRESLDYSILQQLWEASITWPYLEQFYLIPILYLLTKVALEENPS